MFVPVKKNIIVDGKYHFKREIPAGLKVEVEKGKSVKRDAILASGEVFVERDRMDVSTALGVKPKDAGKYLVCINGESIKKGERLAQKSGGVIGKERKLVAVRSGVVDLSEIDGGFLKILGAAKESTSYSGAEGKVVSVMRNKKVDILTKVLKIRPLMVFGHDVQGELFFIESQKSKVGANFSEGLIVLNFTPDREYLRELALLGVEGVIVGSVEAAVLEDISTSGLWGMTLCILEGYGDISANGEVLDVLKKNDGYFCLIDKRSKELILSRVAQKGISLVKKNLVESLKIGSKVQVFDVENWGSYGVVEDLSGTFAKVKIGDKSLNQKVEVNINNLLLC